MSLSIDTLRTEIDERREQVLQLQRQQTQARAERERLERELTKARDRVASCQTQIDHEEQTVEALEKAVALLAERLPEEADPVRKAREEAIERARREREERLNEAKAKAEATKPIPPSAQPGAGHTPNASRDPLAVHPKQHLGKRQDKGPRASKRTVQQRAAELDQSVVTSTDRERAELVALLLTEQGPSDHGRLAAGLADVMRCSERTASTIVSRTLPLLYSQDRIQQVSGRLGDVYGVAWAVTPAEAASARIGADRDNYAGTTTRWPTESDKPGSDTRIQVESGAYEQGKR